MIRIQNFTTNGSDTFREYTCDVQCPEFPSSLSFHAVGSEFPDAGSPNADWAAVALIYPAMKLGQDIEIDGELSPRLYHSLNNDLQAALRIYDPETKRITVRAQSAGLTSRMPTGRIATGFSAGIDSFATLSLYSEPTAPPGIRVTDICVFNVGAMVGTQSGSVDRLFQFNRERSLRFAADNGLRSTSVSSNLNTFYAATGLAFKNSHTFRNAAAALVLEDVFDCYLYSSAFPLTDVRVGNSECAAMDPVTLPMLSTERMQFISAGAGLTRIEKTELVSKDLRARSLLNVCIATADRRVAIDMANCSKCWKCTRTMLTLDALGKLDLFNDVFDIACYRNDFNTVVHKIAIRADQGAQNDREALDFARSAGLPVDLNPYQRSRIRARSLSTKIVRKLGFA